MRKPIVNPFIVNGEVINIGSLSLETVSILTF